MLILACNVGSTSLKYRLYRMDGAEETLARGHFEGIGRASGKAWQKAGELSAQEDAPRPGYGEAITAILGFLTKSGALPERGPDCVAFKVVAALGVSGVVELDEGVLRAMEALSTLLPAHNPPYVAAVRQFRALMPGARLIGSFETGFFDAMPPEAYLYALPVELAERGARRRGAHGASHEYVTNWVYHEMGREDVRLVSCHLGGSSSIAAVRGGRGVDTSLGMSLQSGLPHNNRLGDADPYLSIYLEEALGYSRAEVKELFSRKAGLLGLSGISGELWEIERAALAGDTRAQTALDAYCYQIKKYIGAFAAALGGLDAVAFTGGIGQNSALVREQALSGLSFLGVSLDAARNREAKPDCLVSAPDSAVKVYVVATDEEIVIARKAREYIERHP
ncbi:MAG TPA: acetate/propionate family kinase [Candidatus Limnocylindria bacterium]|nr:acetate/propionate family kinase [Candidatus Limnocylindria bacterium]